MSTSRQPADPEGTADSRPSGEAALQAAWLEHGGACLARARGVLRDAHLAQDAVQEAFVDHWLHPGRWDSTRLSLGAWLGMLTHRKAVDRVRVERRRQTQPLDAARGVEDGQASSFEVALAAVRGARATSALAALTHVHREVVVLAYWGGYTQPEIAKITGAPLGTVKSRTRRALLELAELLGPHEERGLVRARLG